MHLRDGGRDRGIGLPAQAVAETRVIGSTLRAMSRIRSSSAIRLALTLSNAVIIGAALAAAAYQGPAAAPRPALYTDSQAAAGERLYRQSCAACHGFAQAHRVPAGPSTSPNASSNLSNTVDVRLTNSRPTST